MQSLARLMETLLQKWGNGEVLTRQIPDVVADRKNDVTRAPFISFCRCRVETKIGRIPPREVLWNLNFGSPVRVTRTFGGLQNY
jgi:hypothetical protein